MIRSSPFTYSAGRSEHISWPLGGMGAALLALTGNGGIDRIAIRHRPDVLGASFCFAALSFPDHPEWARVLEGPVPHWKIFTTGRSTGPHNHNTANGRSGAIHHGLPRVAEATFRHRFPFASVDLRQQGWPVTASVEAWSPFIPGDADASGLPVAALTYRIRNPGRRRLRAMLSFHCQAALIRERGASDAGERIRRTARGFAIDCPATEGKPWDAGSLVAELDGAITDCAWFRGGYFDPLSDLWPRIAACRAEERPPHAEGGCGTGAGLWLPINLPAGGEMAATVRLAWHEPVGDTRLGPAEPTAAEASCCPDGSCTPATYRPRYATLFPSADAVAEAFHARSAELERRTRSFAEALHATDMPPEALAAVTANLPILRSPTVLRQHDGRLWGWEGCGDQGGCCAGSCTHVWNYAQAIAHLFPDLERGLRETEFIATQDERGHQNFRAALPIRPTSHDFHAAADGQLGGIVKVWREWQISADEAWLRRMWPRVVASLDYCIASWDPGRTGALVEPHHNTYDIEFWGSDGMCGSVYAAALKAAAAMAPAVGADPAPWRKLLAKAVRHLERDLFQRGRFIQQVTRTTPRSGDCARPKAVSSSSYSAEALALLESEGPKYQYGAGVLSDGVIGAWMAETAGLGSPLQAAKVRSHLAQVHRHNLRHDLSHHACLQRPTYANGAEGGLLLCTWPDGGKPTLPFIYSDEVWTGIEYQVASHCIMAGLVDEGLEIVRIARDRYDGCRRNPFDEYECGHWYARALSSWALLQALSGVRYSAVERTLWIAPVTAKRPYRAFLGSGGNFGTITLAKDSVRVVLATGVLAIDRVVIDGLTRPWGVRAEAGTPARLALDRTA